MGNIHTSTPHLKMRSNTLQARLILGALLLLALSNSRSQTIRTTILDDTRFRTNEAITRKRIAFIDLSASQSTPQIVVVNLNGEVLSRFSIPQSRFLPNWIHWGPGITFDKKRQTIWYLAPKVGLTEFDLAGNVIQTLNFAKASHQIQRTDGGGFVLPYSWDEQTDSQVVELDPHGTVLWSWRASEYLKSNPTSISVAPAQPASFTATTSAIKTSQGNFFLSLSQRNLILKVNSNGEVIWSQTVSIRPHTLVVDGDDLIGYSARNPNRVVLKNKDCECFREIVIEEILPGQARTRTLSLQYIASDIWFTSGVDKLYLISDQGKILWQLTHDGLKGRPTGFHSAVIFD
jgi:hypothetical protein